MSLKWVLFEFDKDEIKRQENKKRDTKKMLSG